MEGDGLRRRTGKSDECAADKLPDERKPDSVGKESSKQDAVTLKLTLNKGSYWLTRIVLLRYMAFIYVVAFLVALHQNRVLIGKNGLLPADKYLNDIKHHTSNITWDRFLYAPTILWWFDYDNHIDSLLDTLAYTGLGLAGFVLISGCANIPIMLLLWMTYHSIVNVGQRWYSFGWESQVLETGFLALFLCPLLSLRQVPKHTPTSKIAIFAFRWLIFRIMLGAGLIKLRGDRCWWDLTCMNYHYQTQPIPSPVSYYMHKEPAWFHMFETMVNHVVELPAPFLLLLTRPLCMLGGAIQILFQVILIISGNLSFLNWLTITPCLACFDDASVSWLFSSTPGGAKHQVYKLQKREAEPPRWSGRVRLAFNIAFGLFIIYLSIPAVRNLLATKQKMNHYYGSFRILNSYGKFGSVTKVRTEVIFQGTYDNPEDTNATWLDYEFKCKPGSVDRRPCIITPYHYRLDWLMWFAGFQDFQYNKWLLHLAAKFLVNDEGVTSLIGHNPFFGQKPPKWVRAEHYRYEYTTIGSKAAKQGRWWKRRRVSNYIPAVSLDTLKDFLKLMGWPVPRLPPIVTETKSQ